MANTNPGKQDKFAELAELIAESLAGVISKEKNIQLDQWIANDPDARRYYLEYISLDSGLRQICGVLQEKTESEPFNPLAEVVEKEFAKEVRLNREDDETKRKRNTVNSVLGIDKKESPGPQRKKISLLDVFRVGGAIAALVAFALLLTMIEKSARTPSNRPIPVVATLTGTVDAVWASPHSAISKGEKLTSDLFNLMKGLAEITFADGTQIVLEGPALLNVESSDKLYLQNGKISTIVPEGAEGFTVETPFAIVEDLGTEFAINAREESEVFVYKGGVRLEAKDEKGGISAVEEVTQGQARLITATDRQIINIGIDKELFFRRLPTSYDLSVRRSQPQAYWRFDRNRPGRMENVLNRKSFAGEITKGIRYESGPQWGGLHKYDALSFDGMGSYAMVPNIYPQMGEIKGFTYSMWIRPDKLEVQDIMVFSNIDRWYRRIGINENGQFEAYVFDRLEIRKNQWLANIASQDTGRYDHISVKPSASSVLDKYNNMDVGLDYIDATNGIGLDGNGAHVADSSLDSHWLTAESDQSRWLIADLDGQHQLGYMKIWNLNLDEQNRSYGFKTARIFVADSASNPGNPITDPENWNLLRQVELKMAPGIENYDSPDRIDLEGSQATHVAIVCVNTFHEYQGGTQKIAGLSDVQFFALTEGEDNRNTKKKNNDIIARKYSHNIGQKTVKQGQWYYVTVTTLFGGEKQLYVNGTASGPPVKERFRHLGTHLYLGAVPGQENYTLLSRPFTGAVADVALYGRALGPGEIKQLYQAAVEAD